MIRIGLRRVVIVCFSALLLWFAGCKKHAKAEPGSARELLPSGGAPALLVDVPADYKLDVRNGADFDVFYFKRDRTEHGDKPLDGMGIYVGYAPDFSPPPDARTASATIAGQKATWYAWEDDSSDRTILRMQTVLNGVFAGRKDKAGDLAGLRVHVFIWAPGEKRIGILRDAAETLRRK